MLELQCKNIKRALAQIKEFNKKQHEQFNQEMLEMQQRIEKRMEEQLINLQEGRREYIDKFKGMEQRVHKHTHELKLERKQLIGLLLEMKRSGREIPSSVKTALDLKKKIQYCE